MNLEAVEQRTLSYLKQVSNPLVDLGQLLRYLREDEECADICEKELLDFLRDHELFRVIETSAVSGSPEMAAQLAQAGFSVGPKVILCTRVPTPAQLSAMMQEEIDVMISALNKALDEARTDAKYDDANRISGMIARAERLRAQLGQFG